MNPHPQPWSDIEIEKRNKKTMKIRTSSDREIAGNCEKSVERVGEVAYSCIEIEEKEAHVDNEIEGGGV